MFEMETYFNNVEIEKLVNHANVFAREQNLLLSEFKEIFNDIPFMYDTNNTSKLGELSSFLNINLEKVAINLMTNIDILNTTITRDRELEHDIIQGYDNFTTKIKDPSVDMEDIKND